jgi:hypothetical protein
MSGVRGRPKKARKQEKLVGYWVTMAQYFIIQQKVAKVDLARTKRAAGTALFFSSKK